MLGELGSVRGVGKWSMPAGQSGSGEVFLWSKVRIKYKINGHLFHCIVRCV